MYAILTKFYKDINTKKQWEFYLAIRPHMTEPVSFEEFIKPRPEIKPKTEEEIFREVELIAYATVPKEVREKEMKQKKEKLEVEK